MGSPREGTAAAELLNNSRGVSDILPTGRESQPAPLVGIPDILYNSGTLAKGNVSCNFYFAAYSGD
jgi:hypothetical protein